MGDRGPESIRHPTGFDAAGTLTTSGNGSTTTGEGKGLVSTSPVFTDWAGNSAAATAATYNVDKTAPTVTVDGDHAVSGTLGNNDWYTTDVTVTFKGTDTVSGFDANGATTSTGEATTSGEGTAVTVGNPAFTDYAGNTTAAGAVKSDSFKIDKTPPVITSTGVGSSYVLNQPLTTGPQCTDFAPDGVSDGSGVASCTVTGLDTSKVGPSKATVTATDNAGLTTVQQVPYTVGYKWSGFLQPINDTAHTGLTMSVFKAGSTVPVKFQLLDYYNKPVQAAVLPTFSVAQGAKSTASTDETVYTDTPSSGGTFRYDSTSQQYIYNWKTPTGAYQYKITAGLDDGTPQSVLIATR